MRSSACPLRVLLDEGVPKKITPHLPGHDVTTVQAMGWAEYKNGKLLSLVEAGKFDGFITCDKNMEFQQPKLARRPFAIFLLSTNHFPTMLPHVGKLAEALKSAQPQTLTKVDCGTFVPRRKESPSH